MNDNRRGARDETLDPALLENEVGREFRHGADPDSVAADEVDRPIGAVRRSDQTDVHMPGAGDEETEDGLSPAEEALRHAAEDREDSAGEDDPPVFDRGDTLPRG